MTDEIKQLGEDHEVCSVSGMKGLQVLHLDGGIPARVSCHRWQFQERTSSLTNPQACPITGLSDWPRCGVV